MSLSWICSGKLLKPNLIKFEAQQLDFERDEAVPTWLRDSLISQPMRGFTCEKAESEIPDGTGDAETQKVEEVVDRDSVVCADEVTSEGGENWELAQEYQLDIDGAGTFYCPFVKSSEMEFMMSEISASSQSVVSMIRKCSSMSLFELSDYERKGFLTITGLVPLRNQCVIVHWNVKSTYGIRGFKISVDGLLFSTVYSAERTSALVNNVDMNIPHQFSILAVSTNDNVSASLYRRFSFTNPAIYFHDPI